MIIDKFLDKYYAFLTKHHFASAKEYSDYIRCIYNSIPGAKSILNKLSNENDDLKRIKYCANLSMREAINLLISAMFVFVILKSFL